MDVYCAYLILWKYNPRLGIKYNIHDFYISILNKKSNITNLQIYKQMYT